MSVSKTATGIEAAKLFIAVTSYCVALGFLLYGGRLFFLLRRFPIKSRGRQKKLYEVVEQKSEWKSRWQSQLSELKRRSKSKEAGGNMSWAGHPFAP
ncbi:hypothetical protein SESBI_20066 [Sesbania bispinosa]|nr:hypothetical protein SESBI_20066 [Sesbania bispinosa]